MAEIRPRPGDLEAATHRHRPVPSGEYVTPAGSERCDLCGLSWKSQLHDVTESTEGPEDGHTFRISTSSRGSYKVVGDEKHTDAPDFYDQPFVIHVRAWNLRAALRKAAELPLDAWDYPSD